MFTSSRRALAQVTLLAFLASLALPFLPGVHVMSDRDADCATAIRPLDDARMHVEPVQASGPSRHCVLCHWLRALGVATPGQSLASDPSLVLREPAAPRLALWHGRTVLLDQPSRAPPALRSL